jgi:hypothetical protein
LRDPSLVQEDACVILPWFRKTDHSNITVTNGLDLEDSTTSCEGVERIVDGFEKGEDLRWLSNRAPGSEASDIRKHDSGMREQIGYLQTRRR